MQKLIELYEMVSLNESVLQGLEKQNILKATIALKVFERAMLTFSTNPPEPQPADSFPSTEVWLRAALGAPQLQD